MKLKTILILFLLFTTLLSGIAQPKYEFRAAWVATVNNIDWPSKPGLAVSEQQKEVIRILDMLQDLGMNTVILQIRPTADALYASTLEPWSRYLTGEQGKAPDPFYDPLEFWIEQTHARGMELHAWMNPYRITQKLNEPLAVSHVVFQHPDWVLEYGGKLYFDPGIPDVRRFITAVVQDVVRRYDVDAIHMDDYFYPYPTKDPFPDTVSFQQYNRGFQPDALADWRRENVDITIEMLNDSIKATKPWVKFGISPFGVWRNVADDPNGSETKAGVTNYDDLYANIIKWQEKGWIDYCLPQIYWYIGQTAADFEVLIKWWKNHTYGRAVYIGQAPYRIDPDSETPQWRDPGQIPRQIRMLRNEPELSGSAFFSTKSFYKNLLGFQDSLRTDFYRFPAIIPSMPWLDSTPPDPVTKLRKSGKKLSWEVATSSAEMDKPRQFVIYLNEVGQPFDSEFAGFIYRMERAQVFKFKRMNKKRKKYEVRVSVLDRLNNESPLSPPVVIKL